MMDAALGTPGSMDALKLVLLLAARDAVLVSSLYVGAYGLHVSKGLPILVRKLLCLFSLLVPDTGRADGRRPQKRVCATSSLYSAFTDVIITYENLLVYGGGSSMNVGNNLIILLVSMCNTLIAWWHCKCLEETRLDEAKIPHEKQHR